MGIVQTKSNLYSCVLSWLNGLWEGAPPHSGAMEIFVGSICGVQTLHANSAHSCQLLPNYIEHLKSPSMNILKICDYSSKLIG